MSPGGPLSEFVSLFLVVYHRLASKTAPVGDKGTHAGEQVAQRRPLWPGELSAGTQGFLG